MAADQSKSLQAAGLLEASGAQPAFQAAVSAAVDLVAGDDLPEGSVVQLVPTGQGDAFGLGGGHGSELEPLEPWCEFGDAGHG